MINPDFERFNQIQKKHQGEHLGTDRKQRAGLNDRDFNNQSITDKSPGATGR
ncbi:hypothetical protein JK635_19945 [Neobacillus sp. YIM B02564]|uniref:YpzG family protein n=1 Tax=Neobacillus paridis TaxID=2803862 RepID=A0ABS1TUL9_9BACI|nr:hypothetical protein [Neobacillus paridis]MBL4954434.1 hypothetical protein [Neobacillus paridis]